MAEGCQSMGHGCGNWWQPWFGVVFGWKFQVSNVGQAIRQVNYLKLADYAGLCSWSQSGPNPDNSPFGELP